MPARRKARKRALDVLYEADLRDLPPTRVLSTYLDRIAQPRPDHLDYTIMLVEGVAKELDRIDELLASFAEGWTLDRMPVVDRKEHLVGIITLGDIAAKTSDEEMDVAHSLGDISEPASPDRSSQSKASGAAGDGTVHTSRRTPRTGARSPSPTPRRSSG